MCVQQDKPYLASASAAAITKSCICWYPLTFARHMSLHVYGSIISVCMLCTTSELDQKKKNQSYTWMIELCNNFVLANRMLSTTKNGLEKNQQKRVNFLCFIYMNMDVYVTYKYIHLHHSYTKPLALII